MKTSPKCVSCFFRQIEVTSRLLKFNAAQKEKALNYLTRRLLKFDFGQPPVVFGRTIYKGLARLSGTKDIFAREKIKAEDFLLGFSGQVEGMLQRAKNPLYLAAKLSCAANAIDFGAGSHPDIKHFLSQLKRIRLKVNHFPLLKEKLASAKTVLFIADNCGETFFDKFFISQIAQKLAGRRIFYAVRSAPMINDALLSDARRLKLNRVAQLVSSGCDYPGLILAKTSPRFKRIYRQADLVISKGQGNFESLRGKKNIFYLFKVKCPTVSDFLRLPQGSLLLMHNRYGH